MRIAGVTLLPKPEVWVLTMDIEDRVEGFEGGWAIKAYSSEGEALREKRLAENLVLGCITFLIQNSDKSVRRQLLERERVWLDLCELLPKGFGPDGHLKATSKSRPNFDVEKLDLLK